MWGLARATGGRDLLRIEDHDRPRCRPEYDAALLEDLSWLGFVADLGPVRQSDDDAPYAAGVARLRADGLVYGCDCTRSLFAARAELGGRPWSGPGCPGRCRQRGIDGPMPAARDRRADPARGPGRRFRDLDGRIGRAVFGRGGPRGDLPIRDRHGGWTYGLCVVVDDLRQGIGLVVRGRDLLHATPAQIRLGRLLGREAPPALFHHPLIRQPDGSKLSKSSGATGVRELRAAGWSAAAVIDAAASASGWRAPGA